MVGCQKKTFDFGADLVYDPDLSILTDFLPLRYTGDCKNFVSNSITNDYLNCLGVMSCLGGCLVTPGASS